MQCPNCGQQIESSVRKERVYHEHFRGSWSTWESLFQDAADFAARVGPENLISISHSEDHNEGVVTVWYWGSN